MHQKFKIMYNVNGRENKKGDEESQYYKNCLYLTLFIRSRYVHSVKREKAYIDSLEITSEERLEVYRG